VSDFLHVAATWAEGHVAGRESLRQARQSDHIARMSLAPRRPAAKLAPPNGWRRDGENAGAYLANVGFAVSSDGGGSNGGYAGGGARAATSRATNERAEGALDHTAPVRAGARTQPVTQRSASHRARRGVGMHPFRLPSQLVGRTRSCGGLGRDRAALHSHAGSSTSPLKVGCDGHRCMRPFDCLEAANPGRLTRTSAWQRAIQNHCATVSGGSHRTRHPCVPAKAG